MIMKYINKENNLIIQHRANFNNRGIKLYDINIILIQNNDIIFLTTWKENLKNAAAALIRQFQQTIQL